MKGDITISTIVKIVIVIIILAVVVIGLISLIMKQSNAINATWLEDLLGISK